MVTLRAFSNPAQAALAKSLLDDHGIVSSLADENSYLYGGAYLAMPVRLVVAEEQLEEAARILSDPPDGLHVEPAVEAEIAQASARLRREEESSPQNPWQFLALALLLVIPGVMLLAQKQDLLFVVFRRSRHWTTAIPPSTSHVVGIAVVAVSAVLVFLYFYIRRDIAREDSRGRGWRIED